MLPPPRTLTADRGDAGRRLDLVVRRHLTDVGAATRTRVQAWIESGHVTVNGTAVRRTSARTAAGDVVCVALPEGSVGPRYVMAAEDTPVVTLFEDEHLLAVDKPAGIVVHPSYRNTSGTMMNALLWKARGWPRGQRPSLVSRLDKGTSGVLLVAKTAAMHAALQRAMTANDAVKEYLAVVYGRVAPMRGHIDLRVAHDPVDRRRMTASTIAGARSLTRYERLAYADARPGGLSLLSCRLSTGRTHQIRVHLAARGWPIVGDPVYGEPPSLTFTNASLAAVVRGFPRQALHACQVAFNHPVTGDRVTITAPRPPDVAALLAAAGLTC